MLPINATNLQTGTVDEALVQAKAQELCVFDWNRKPRGPKGKKAAFAAAFGVENPKTVSKEQAATHVGGGAHRVFARLPFEQAVLLSKTD